VYPFDNIIRVLSQRMTSVNAYPRQPTSHFQQDLLELFLEAEHTHDITLEINHCQTFPAHKYILAMRSPYFRERISKNVIDHLSIEHEANRIIDSDLFRMILEYIYSDRCPWLNFVQRTQIRDDNERQKYLSQLNKNDDDDIDDHRYFARARQQAAMSSSTSDHTRHTTKSKKKKKNSR
jgi:hypothetical protein